MNTPLDSQRGFCRKRWHRFALAGVLALLPALAAGCNVVTAGMYIVEGPPSIDPAYELDTERLSMVFVDDPGNTLPRREMRLTIASEVQRRLLEIVKLTNVIETRDAINIADASRSSKLRSVVSIGREASRNRPGPVEQLIYARIDGFALGAVDGASMPTAAVTVMVFDAKLDARIWPDPQRVPEGFQFRVAIPQRVNRAPTNRADLEAAQNAFALKIGEAIAQCFYKHDRTESLIQGGRR
ncbi:MAG: hypothetical protein SFY95_09495 [Planctomycetota bacterium]|nr:hypothetical protein [Planctomycetota bacterium]